MKQTAVEYVKDELTALMGTLLSDEALRIIDQAKEMEKEQIMSAFTQGDIFGADFFDRVNITAEQYYNETFKSK